MQRWQPQDCPKHSDIFLDLFFHSSVGPHNHQELSLYFPPLNPLPFKPSKAISPASEGSSSTCREQLLNQVFSKIINCPFGPVQLQVTFPQIKDEEASTEVRTDNDHLQMISSHLFYNSSTTLVSRCFLDLTVPPFVALCNILSQNNHL